MRGSGSYGTYLYLAERGPTQVGEALFVYCTLQCVYNLQALFTLYDLLFIASVHLHETAKPARIYCMI